MELIINIDYDLEHDLFCYRTNIKQKYLTELISDFLRAQIGKGIDERPRTETDLYQIDLQVDLSDDGFSSRSNCGNLGLRDGILIEFLKRLSK